MSDLEKLIESNAKAITALTSDIQEMKYDRDRMYGVMRDLAQNQNRIYDVMRSLDDRQHQLSNQQQQLIEILKKLSEK